MPSRPEAPAASPSRQLPPAVTAAGRPLQATPPRSEAERAVLAAASTFHADVIPGWQLSPIAAAGASETLPTPLHLPDSRRVSGMSSGWVSGMSFDQSVRHLPACSPGCVQWSRARLFVSAALQHELLGFKCVDRRRCYGARHLGSISSDREPARHVRKTGTRRALTEALVLVPG